MVRDRVRVTVDYRNAAVVRAAIRLARELGLEVIAEGVETEAQVRFLLGAGCEQAQGYFFSRPVTAEKATELLRAGRIEPAATSAPQSRLFGGLNRVSEIGVAQRVEPAAVPLGRAGSLASIAIRCLAARAESNPRKASAQGSPGPRRSDAPSTRTTASLPRNAAVTTSPACTSRLDFSARSPLTRTLPASISRAAPVRVLASLAHQSHLSSR